MRPPVPKVEKALEETPWAGSALEQERPKVRLEKAGDEGEGG